MKLSRPAPSRRDPARTAPIFSTARFTEEGPELVFLIPLGGMLLPDEGIRGHREEGIDIVGAQRPELEERAFQRGLEFEGHSMSLWATSRDEVVVSADDLPAPSSPYPGIRESVAATELSLRSAASHNQPSGHDGRRGEAMDFHVLVAGGLDCVRSGDDIVQHGVATDGPIVLGVDEAVRQQPLKERGITPGQAESPIVLEAKEHVGLGILDARDLNNGLGSLRGEQQGNEKRIHPWTPAMTSFGARRTARAPMTDLRGLLST
jgi:hypothetical protein